MWGPRGLSERERDAAILKEEGMHLLILKGNVTRQWEKRHHPLAQTGGCLEAAGVRTGRSEQDGAALRP